MLRPRPLRTALRAFWPLPVTVRALEQPAGYPPLSAFRGGKFRHEPEALPAQGRLFLAALHGHKVVGVLRAIRARPGWQLAGLDVGPLYWGRHVARALLTVMLAELGHLGARRVWLRVHLRARAARALYADLGFHSQTPPQKGFVILSRELGAQP